MIWSAGIDLGGTNVKAIAVTADGTVLHRVTRATHDGAASVAEWKEHACAAVAGFARALGAPPVSIGVCAPGLAAADGRSIAHLPGKLAGLAGLDWTHALFGDSGAPSVGLPLLGTPSRPSGALRVGSAPRAGPTPYVPVLNDAHAAILGEAWVGAARGQKHVVMLTLGTGVGGAVISDGRLLRGAIGRAGHIGHMSLDPEGPVSITGMPGAIEVMIGDSTVATRTSGKFSTTAALVAAHRAGDAEATRVWLHSIRALGCALGSCINLFDPAVIVVGGGIAQAGDALFAPLASELERVEWRPGGHRVPVVPATLGEWAGAIGAARHSLP